MVIGLAGAIVMATVMAAITGVGVLQLSSRVAARDAQSGFAGGQRAASSLLGTGVYDNDGHRLGPIRDLVTDLSVDVDRVPVTKVLIGRGPRSRVVPWAAHTVRRGAEGFAVAHVPKPVDEVPLGPTEVLVRRDVLDSPVIVADPPRRARVSDVALDVDAAGAWVAGLDVSTAGALRRLLPRQAGRAIVDPVPLSRVHLASPQAHTAQLAVSTATVFRLDPAEMAEVLTRASVTHARDIMQLADQKVLDQALALLHPHVRARVTGAQPPPRRVSRLRGWRLHRPGGPGTPGGAGGG